MTSKGKSVKSAKGAKSLKIVRNVLVQPFKIQWPCVQLGEEREKLVKLLEQIPKDVVHGTNPVNHLLSKGLASALFISSDFHPQILGKQIIQMARRNYPEILILALECLSWNGKPEKLVAVRNTSNDPDNVKELLNLMVDVCKSKGYVTEASKNPVIETRKLKKRQTNVEDFPLEELDRLYIPRPTSGKRAFVPQVSIYAGKQTADAKKEDWGEFISFKRPTSEVKEGNLKRKSKRKKNPVSTSTKANASASEDYVPLTVNRIQGNPNRKEDKKKEKVTVIINN